MRFLIVALLVAISYAQTAGRDPRCDTLPCDGCIGRRGLCNSNSEEQCEAAFQFGAVWCGQQSCLEERYVDLDSLLSYDWEITFPNNDALADRESCLSDSFHGWSGGNHVGTASRIMSGQGTATLTFGNCWNAGVTNVYLDGENIATAPIRTNSESVTFHYTDGQRLEVKDESGNAVVSLTGMKVCSGQMDSGRYDCSRVPPKADLSGCQNCGMNRCVLECDCGRGRTSINTKHQCTDGTITSIGGALVCVNAVASEHCNVELFRNDELIWEHDSRCFDQIDYPDYTTQSNGHACSTQCKTLDGVESASKCHDIVKNSACEATHFSYRPGRCWAKSGDGRIRVKPGYVSGSIQTSDCVTEVEVPYEEYGDSNELISDQPPCNRNGIDDNQCRLKSTTVFQPASSSTESDFNGLLWSFGQFVDHDLDLIAEDEHDQVDIPFDSTHTFKFSRAKSHCENGEYGKRKNEITARIDLSQVYGSTLARENALRDPNNLTKIKAVDSDVLPPSPNEIFCCGDARCAENPFLTAQHVLWLKHHNMLVDELVTSGTQLTGEDLYQEAKRQNIAIYQRIVDEEFLPALVGPTPPAITVNSGHWILHTYDSAKVDIGLLSLNGVGKKVSLELCRDMVLSLDVCEKRYISYSSTSGECACTTVETTGIATGSTGWKTYQISPEWHDEQHFSHGDMSISNLFANAAYRLHHLVNDKFDIDGREDTLGNHFFNAVSFSKHGKLDGWFTRLLKQKSNKFGATIANSLQHALFTAPTKQCQDDNTDCRDLAALNCLRGVDVGLPTYNEVREIFGLPQREDFDWSTCDGKLEQVYGGDIDRVELFFGGSCEPPMTGAVLGETFLVIVKDQFLRLRDNDPHWIGHQSRGFTYKEVIERCTRVDPNLFHSDSSLLHRD